MKVKCFSFGLGMAAVVIAGLFAVQCATTHPGGEWTGSATAPIHPAGMSASKLSIHLLGKYTPGAHEVVKAGPPVLKVLDPQGNGDMLAGLLDYHRHWPQGYTVVRIWENTPDTHYPITADPEASADHYWNTVLAPAVAKLSPEARAAIDFLEGPNENETCPTWQEGVEGARWFGRFEARLAQRIAEGGYRPLLANISVANPPGSRGEIGALLDAYSPALYAAQEYGGAWAYHGYTCSYSTDPEEEVWYSLRYRIFYAYLRKHHPELASLPMILTEAGVDYAGNAYTDGWQARGTAADYQEWLLWYDKELQKDPYIIGATLFQSGDAIWPSFELEPILPWLADYIAKARP